MGTLIIDFIYVAVFIAGPILVLAYGVGLIGNG